MWKKSNRKWPLWICSHLISNSYWCSRWNASPSTAEIDQLIGIWGPLSCCCNEVLLLFLPLTLLSTFSSSSWHFHQNFFGSGVFPRLNLSLRIGRCADYEIVMVKLVILGVKISFTKEILTVFLSLISALSLSTRWLPWFCVLVSWIQAFTPSSWTPLRWCLQKLKTANRSDAWNKRGEQGCCCF